MRVLVMNQYFPPDSSATARLLGELAEDLAVEHEVLVVAGRPSYTPSAGETPPRDVHLRRPWSTTFSRRSMAGRMANYGSFMVGALVSSLKGPRPDVVVALTDPPVIGIVGMLAGARWRVPFVYVCWDIFPDVGVALGKLDNPLLVGVWRGVNAILRRRAARVVAVGRDMSQKLQAEGVPAEKIAIIPHWAPDGAISPAEVAETRHEQEWEGVFVVMHAGNVGLAQNLDTLLEAAELLRDRSDIALVVLGDGAARPRLQREAEGRGLSNLRFLPFRPRREASSLLAAADVHLISLAPGLWGSVVASKVYGVLSAGRPFVAAVDAGSEIDRIAAETGAGVRVEPGDAPALAQAVLDFADGHLDPTEAGRRARAAFEENYRRSLATRSYGGLLENLRGE